MIKIKGMRGSWMADVVGGDRLPVVHFTFVDWKKLQYEEGDKNRWDNYKKANGESAYQSSRWYRHYETIKAKGAVIIQMDKRPPDESRVAIRNGYWGIAYVDNVQWNDGVITFDITGRQK